MKRIIKTLCASLLIISLCFSMSGCFVLQLIFGNAFSTEFTLTEYDVQKFEAAAEKFENGVLEGKNVFLLSRWASAFSNEFNHINTQYLIAYINYCEDTKDAKALSDYEYAVGAYSKAGNLYNETLKNLLNSDSDYAAMIFENWSELDKQMLLNNNAKAYELSQKNESLLIEYRALDIESETWVDDVDAIYLELLTNRSEIAKEYGYSNYYDYASEVENQRSYSSEDREALRGYVREYIVPLFKSSLSKLEALIEESDEATVSEFRSLMRADYLESAAVQRLISDYLDSFMLTDTNGYYTGIGYHMEWMLDAPGRAVFASGENSYPGAFTTYLFDYSEPIAFFGPGYHNMFTVVHEMGHYGAFSRHGMGAPIDFCEVHSQSNEWLFVAFLEDELSPEVHELIELSKLVEGLELIILSVAVDECEERLYTSEVQSIEDISSIVSEVASLYGEDISEKLQLEKYFRHVAPENPTYYLNYAVSEIVSMGNYVDATEDLAKAQSDYDDFIYDSYDPEITKLGLRDAFEEETYEALIDTFSGEDGADNGDGEDTDGKTDGGTLVFMFDGELMPAA